VCLSSCSSTPHFVEGLLNLIGPIPSPCDEGVVRGTLAGPGSGDGAVHDRRWVLAATIAGSSLAFIDATVVNVALPAIQASLAAPVSDAQWIVNAYSLMLSALILVGGAAGDRFGRRRVCLYGISIFTAASVASGLAPNALVLIVARAIQGIGGALLVPSSLAVISAAFPAAERARAIGTWAGASALTSALGPVLGGWLVDTWSWRAIFFINLPIGILALLLMARRVPESGNEVTVGVDWRGGLLAVAGLGLLTYALTMVSSSAWSNLAMLGLLAGGVLALLVLLWWEAHTPAPMLPLKLFRSWSFSGANAMTLLLYFALSGALFFVPFELIDIQGYSAAQAGAAFLPLTLVMAALSRWAGGLAVRYGERLPLVVGPLIATVGLVLLALAAGGGSYWTSFFPAMTVLGLGMAISVAPLTTTVMRSAGDRYAGAASGINNATARVAGLLAVALLGALAVGAFTTALDGRLAQLHTAPAIADVLRSEVQKLAEAPIPAVADKATQQDLRRAIDQSFIVSFRIVMLIAAAAALLSALCARLTIDRVSTHHPDLR
jgi:EmrB/QacA subfamily drug resistance transporter